MAKTRGLEASKPTRRGGARATTRKSTAQATTSNGVRASTTKGKARSDSSKIKGKSGAAETKAKSRAAETKGKRGAAESKGHGGKNGAAAGRARPRRAEEHARLAAPKRLVIDAVESPRTPPQAPELDWDDTPGGRDKDALAARWAGRGDELFRKLAEHGASRHEVRADLRGGRFVWLSPEGRVSAEASAQVLCSWSRATSVVAMAWADPLVRSAGVERIDGMASELDDIDEEGAWRIAMEAAEASGAAYLYRVSAPHAWYFLALRDLSFVPKRASFHPGTPVGLVLRALGEVREAVESRAEPAEVLRDRLRALGQSLFHQAEYAYRGTDWVARLVRTGERLMHLAKRIPRPSFGAVAAGHRVEEWLNRELTLELIEAIGLLEDEWGLFA